MKYLNSDTKVMGGELVVKGTRTPITVLLHYLKAGYSVEEIQDLYPWIPMETLKGAFDEAIDVVARYSHA